MKLTTYTNYALRSLQLAALKAPNRIKVDDVVQVHGLARPHMVRLTEGPLDLVECFNPEKNTCPLIGICKLSRALQTATKAFMAILDDLTLADIASNKGELLARIAPIEEGIVAPMRMTR
jgi:Rrf2 family nitric oxide-sensitive transcriptional repressor